MEMSYDEAYAIASGEIKDAKTILLLQHAKIKSSFKTIFLEFRNMNNQKKVFYSHCALPYFGQ
jgi:hypothetical protein